MTVNPEDSEFWDLVEHEMKVRQAGTWRSTMLLIRIGMAVVLMGASHLLFSYLLSPPSGYFFTAWEIRLPPFYWILAGLLFIIAGAYLRFRAIGPIADHINEHGPS